MGSTRDTLVEHQNRGASRTLPAPSIIAEHDAEWARSGQEYDCASSLASFSTRLTGSSRGVTSGKRSAPSSSQPAIGLKKRRTKWEVMASGEHAERLSVKLLQDQKGVLKTAGMLFVEEICTHEPWQGGEPKQLMVSECLSQANMRSMQRGKTDLDESREIKDEVSNSSIVLSTYLSNLFDD